MMKVDRGYAPQHHSLEAADWVARRGKAGWMRVVRVCVHLVLALIVVPLMVGYGFCLWIRYIATLLFGDGPR